MKSKDLINSDSFDNGNQSQNNFKYVKSKEQIKKLMCHIIGIYAILHDGQRFKASHLARMLKKESKELKSYFTELGLEATPIKENEKDDLLVSSNFSYKEKSSRKRSKDLEQPNAANNSENIESVVG